MARPYGNLNDIKLVSRVLQYWQFVAENLAAEEAGNVSKVSAVENTDKSIAENAFDEHQEEVKKIPEVDVEKTWKFWIQMQMKILIMMSTISIL